jgi:hypothetical protein
LCYGAEILKPQISLALTAMEFLMQEAAVFLGIQERLQEALVCHRKARPINKNAMKGRNNSKKESFFKVDFMKQPFNNVIYHLATTKQKRPYIAVKSLK